MIYHIPISAFVSENAANNQLYTSDIATSTWMLVGPTGTNNIEAIAYDPVNGVLYATNLGDLGTLDLTTGAFTPKSTVGILTGDYDGDGNADDVIFMDDIDGLSYDPATGILWASNRINGVGGPDVLFQIDLATCTVITNAFGPGEDYFVVPTIPDPMTGAPLGDVDDIAWDPFQGFLYMIQNEAGLGDVLTYYDTNTGTITTVGPITQDDMEGLGMDQFGGLFGTTGNGGGSSFFSIDKMTGMATFLSAISAVHVDFESVDCATNMSDLALSKVLSPTQAQPIDPGDQVCFDITIHNQGMVDNYNVQIVDYIPAGLTLADPNWTLTGGNAVMNYPGPLLINTNHTIPICFIVDAGANGVITNTAEISQSQDIAGTVIPDIDSVADNMNNETNVQDNEINGSGPGNGEDEDDHDIAAITILVSPCAMPGCNPVPVEDLCATGDMSESLTLICQSGLTNVVWYNSTDSQVGTGCALAINLNMIGNGAVGDSECFYYIGEDDAGCSAQSCCPTTVRLVECCPVDNCRLITITRN